MGKSLSSYSLKLTNMYTKLEITPDKELMFLLAWKTEIESAIYN